MKISRRQFIKLSIKSLAVTGVGGGIYGAFAARNLQVTRRTITLPNLPLAFRGTTIAFLSDIHHSAVVPLSFVQKAVTMTNALAPDLVVLGGDYITANKPYFPRGTGIKYIAPCFDTLRNLKSRLGTFGVTGNHDTKAGVERITTAMRAAGIEDISNGGVWLSEKNQRMRLCGVADFLTQVTNSKAALGDATESDAVVMASHNPDFTESLRDTRSGLVLCGHTHGGQVVVPFFGAPITASFYGQKYRYGVVRAPATQVCITSGVGTLPLAIRINCPPEIALITLV